MSLLGDAAHPMLPHLGQGANQSIEDGMALATILARADRETAPAALLAYELLRRERVAQVQRGARENGLRYDSAYSDFGLRDAEIAAHADSASGSTTTTWFRMRKPRRRRWRRRALRRSAGGSICSRVTCLGAFVGRARSDIRPLLDGLSPYLA